MKKEQVKERTVHVLDRRNNLLKELGVVEKNNKKLTTNSPSL